MERVRFELGHVSCVVFLVGQNTLITSLTLTVPLSAQGTSDELLGAT